MQFVRAESTSNASVHDAVFPPSKRLAALEVQLVSKIWHAPGILFSRAMIGHMQKLSNTRMLLPTAVCWATFVRAAVSTFKPIASTGERLRGLAEQHLPWRDFIEGARSPSFWRSPCFASRLWEGRVSLVVPRGCAVKEVEAAQRAMVSASLNAETRKSRKGIQKVAAEHFVSKRFPINNLWQEFRRRASAVLGDSSFLLSSESVFCECMQGTKPHTAQCFIRTVLNGWPTQHRLPVEEPRSCVFGCQDGAPDHFQHYWHDCPRFAGAMRLIKVCFSEDQVRFCAVAFSAYCEASRFQVQSVRPRWQELFEAAAKLHLQNSDAKRAKSRKARGRNVAHCNSFNNPELARRHSMSPSGITTD